MRPPQCAGRGVFRRSGVQAFRRSRTPRLNARTPERLTLEYLEQLRESSLVLAEEVGGGEQPAPGTAEMRFRLLETLREYGAEQLAREEQAELARRHAEYYLALVEAAEP